VSLSVAGDARAAAAELTQVAGVQESTAREGGIDVLVAGARNLLPRLLEVVTRDGVSVRSVEVIEPDLESVFLHLTGKALRD
jgi:ABC-2 type transport system ATP-binding protein